MADAKLDAAAVSDSGDTGSSSNCNNQYKEARMVSADGQQIFYRTWTTVNKPRALVFIIHGAGEHSGWYDKTARELHKNGVIVTVHDQLGHGQSEGEPVDVTDFDVYIRDLWQLVDAVATNEHAHNLPIFFLGFSMGGTVAIEAANSRPTRVRGVVLWGPAIVNDVAPAWKVSLCSKVAKQMPQMPVSPLLDHLATRDKAVIEQQAKDPLAYHGWLKARFTSIFLTRLQDIAKRLDKITWPFLVLHGGHDKLCLPKGSQQLYDKAASKDKTIKIFPDAFHQIHNELPPVAAETLQLTVDWITKRCASEF